MKKRSWRSWLAGLLVLIQVFCLLPSFATAADITGLTNNASGKDISGLYDTGWEISRLVDGNTSDGPGWGITQTDSLVDSPVVFVINLGEVMAFDTFRMYPRNFYFSEVQNFPTAYTIEVSNDNAAWNTVHETTNGPVPADVNTPVDVELSQVANGQYIRFTITGVNKRENDSNWVIQVNELEIYNSGEVVPPPLTNLALNKTVVGSADSGWEIDRLVNGTITGEPGWGITLEGTTLAASPVTFTVDLGAVKSFDIFRLYPRDFFASEVKNFPTSYTIEVSTDNSAWNTVHETTNGPVPANVSTYVDVELSQVANGQYIRFTINGVNVDEYSDKGVIQVNELEIYYSDENVVTPPTNIALGKEVTAPAKDAGWSADRLVDGDISGSSDDWNLGWGVSQDQSFATAPVDVVINLGEAKEFTTFRIYPRNFGFGEVQNFPNAYTISVSNDNSSWTQVYETTNGQIPANVDTPIDVTLARTANAQYVKITIKGINKQESSNWTVELNELEIYNIAIEGEEAIEAVEEKIAAIGTVTLASEAAITTARAAYDALSEEQKALVANYDVLTAAEAAFAQLEEDNADPTENIALNKVVSGPAKDSGWSIDRLVDGDISGSTDDWNLGWGVEQGSSFADSPVTIVIDLARARLFNTFKIYPRDAFFSQVQNFPIAYTISVSNDNSAWTKVYETDNGPIPADVNTPAVVTLDDVARARYVKITFTGINRQESGSKWELQLNELEIYYIKRDAAVEAVEDLIDAIGTVTLNSEDAITAARNAYDALDAAKRAEVNNYALLTAAEATLKSLKDAKAAEDVEALIDSIGTVTLASEAQIHAARDAYDALTNEQKNLVDNYDTLVAAEEALSELRKDEYAKPGNIAYGNDVSGPSDSGWNADRLVDGVTSGDTGNWNLGWGITQDSSFADAPVTLIIDLGAAKAFNTFKIYPRDAFFSEVQNFPTAYTIAVRNGNESWKVVYETTNGPVPADVNTPATLTLDRTANAQYIMITISGINKQEDAAKWTVQLTELELYSIENADEQAVVAVEALINAIGDVTLESETEIAAAREAYAALTDAQKAMVLNYKTLTEAEAKLAWLKTASDSEKAIAKVEALIDGIGEVTMNSESAINAAREAYGALTTEEKLLIKNYEVLTVAETRLAQLKKAAADKTAADAVAELIDAIGTVTLNSEVAIDVARRAYNALTLEQKALVANYSALTKAEVTFAQLKNEPSDIPDTGDHAILAAAVALMFVSTACGVAMVTRRKKNV